MYFETIVASQYGAIIPENQIAYINTTVKFFCYSVTLPTWYKRIIIRKKIVSRDAVLVLRNVTELDTGVYICEGRFQNRTKFNVKSELNVGGK